MLCYLQRENNVPLEMLKDFGDRRKWARAGFGSNTSFLYCLGYVLMSIFFFQEKQ